MNSLQNLQKISSLLGMMRCHAGFGPTHLSCRHKTRNVRIDRIVKANLNEEGVKLTNKFQTTKMEKAAKMIRKLTLLPSSKPANDSTSRSKAVSTGVPDALDHPLGGHAKLLERRQEMLNLNFMDAITDVMASENCRDVIEENGVSITSVEISRNGMYLSIYYTYDGRKPLRETHEALNGMRSQLRRLIIERNFVSKCPMIFFVYDRKTEGLNELEAAFRGIDMGPDHEPTHPSQVPTFSELLYKTRKGTRTKSHGNDECVEDEQSETSPVGQNISFYPHDMKLDTFGLKHDEVMAKVRAKMRKVRAAHRAFNATSDPLPPADWTTPLYVIPPAPQLEDPLDPVSRVKAMRQFMIENRKKKKRLRQQARREANIELFTAGEHLGEVQERMLTENEYHKTLYEEEDMWDDVDK